MFNGKETCSAGAKGSWIYDFRMEMGWGSGNGWDCSTHKGAGVESYVFVRTIAVVQVRNSGFGYGASREEKWTNSVYFGGCWSQPLRNKG